MVRAREDEREVLFRFYMLQLSVLSVLQKSGMVATTMTRDIMFSVCPSVP